MALVGEVMEVRIYSELIPMVTLSLVVALRAVAREASTNASSVPASSPVPAAG